MNIKTSNFFTNYLDELILKNNKIIVDNLAIIQIGNIESSNTYVKIKQNTAKKLGISTKLYKFDENIEFNTLTKEIELIAKDKKNSSVIIQLPLISSLYNKLLDLIPIEKDIDLLSKKSQTLFYSNKLPYGSPITRATEYVLNSIKLLNENTNALVVGSGFLVGNPIIHLLKNKHIRFSVTNNYKPSDAKNKNLIITTAGVPRLVKGSDLEPSTSVIDFGYSKINGKTVGDFDINSKTDHLNYIIPSPKGMGPIVVRFLFMNHLKINDKNLY